MSIVRIRDHVYHTSPDRIVTFTITWPGQATAATETYAGGVTSAATIQADTYLGINSTTSALPEGVRARRRKCEYKSRCNLSTCLVCAKRRSWQKTRNIIANIQHRKGLYHAVPTVRANADLRQALAVLYDAAKRLRKHQYWRDHVAGGIFNLDAGYQDHGGTWTPHFHIIFEQKKGKKIRRDAFEKQVREIWHALTGGSDNVKVDLVNRTPERLTAYAMKVAFQRFEHIPQAKETWTAATRYRRKVQKFGTWLNTRTDKRRWNPKRKK